MGIVLTPRRAAGGGVRKNRILLVKALSPGKVGPMQVFADLPSE